MALMAAEGMPMWSGLGVDRLCLTFKVFNAYKTWQKQERVKRRYM
jgi:hypothetical protein